MQAANDVIIGITLTRMGHLHESAASTTDVPAAGGVHELLLLAVARGHVWVLVPGHSPPRLWRPHCTFLIVLEEACLQPTVVHLLDGPLQVLQGEWWQSLAGAPSLPLVPCALRTIPLARRTSAAAAAAAAAGTFGGEVRKAAPLERGPLGQARGERQPRHPRRLVQRATAVAACPAAAHAGLTRPHLGSGLRPGHGTQECHVVLVEGDVVQAPQLGIIDTDAAGIAAGHAAAPCAWNAVAAAQHRVPLLPHGGCLMNMGTFLAGRRTRRLAAAPQQVVATAAASVAPP
mmetsp:Transcript_68017/g.191709  ORF Transcript_68017/g.191709 Transcript_68017/m.191709 type:complete len:289 (-) Transcript_68017:411-1277(-)